MTINTKFDLGQLVICKEPEYKRSYTEKITKIIISETSILYQVGKCKIFSEENLLKWNN